MYNQYVYKEPVKVVEAPAIGGMTLNKNFQTGPMSGQSQGMGALAAPWGNGTTYQQFANSSAATRAPLSNSSMFDGYWTSQKDKQSWDPNYISPDEVRYFLQYHRGAGQQFVPSHAKQQHGRVQGFTQDTQKVHLETLPDGTQRYVLDNKSLADEARAIRQFMINGANGGKPAAPAGPSAADMASLANQSAIAAYQQLQAQQSAQQQQQSDAQAQYQMYLQQQRQAASKALAEKFGYSPESLGIPMGALYG